MTKGQQKEKYFIYAGVAFCVLLLVISFFQQMKNKDLKEAAKLPYPQIQIEQVADGSYTQKVQTSFLHVELTVTVKDEKITEIKVLENKGSRGQNVESITQTMILQNNAVVPLIEGEEIASLVFISCVEQALSQGIKK